MTEKERMLSGKLYMGIGTDEELTKEHRRARQLTRLYNQTSDLDRVRQVTILSELFGSMHDDICIEPDFNCDYGSHIHIGKSFYANYGCVVLDVNDVIIGDCVFFGPQIGVYAAGHPVDARVRNTCLEYGKSIHIGNNVWVGGLTVINPGVSIGDGTVIGSGSVVTHDIPSGVLAAGNPCSVLREITEEDVQFWAKLRREHDD